MQMMRVMSGVAMAVLLAGCAEQLSGLDQSLYGVANSVSTQDRVTGSRILASGDRAAQIAESNAAIDQQLAKLTAGGGKINADVDPAGYAKLVTITQRIIQASHFAGEASQWKVVLLPEKDFNAYVNGGSYVMVYKGLLDSVKSDDEIAAVIGHEVGHVAANHVGRQQAYQIVSLLDRKNASNDAFGESFTLAQEQQADQIGILYAALAGYDPMAASTLWNRLYAQQGQSAGLISSHPLNGDRAASTKQIGQQVAQYRVAGRVNPQAQEILVNNVLWQRSTLPQLAAGQGGGLLAVAQTAWTTYQERETAQGLAEAQTARAAQVKAVQQALVVRNINGVDPDTVVVQMTYQGTQPLAELRLALQTAKARVIASAGAVAPGATFDVTFSQAGSGVGGGGKVTIAVDEVR
ncbi:MAG: peptidase M48 [Blastochloris viridis]|uniref:Peptidase M48 n=1 Tax=Blastochloris viridis TaxID=1079 RepID=A0A6N4RC71_BLAVI|nr:MAG: peptidase M48 [Blastochloris viridis]